MYEKKSILKNSVLKLKSVHGKKSVLFDPSKGSFEKFLFFILSRRTFLRKKFFFNRKKDLENFRQKFFHLSIWSNFDDTKIVTSMLEWLKK